MGSIYFLQRLFSFHSCVCVEISYFVFHLEELRIPEESLKFYGIAPEFLSSKKLLLL